MLSFTEDAPKVGETFNLKGLKSWEGLSDKTKVMMGTGVYETTIKLSKDDVKKQWAIDLGDVRESAQEFSTECCKDIYNYVSKEFGEQKKKEL